MAGYGPVTQVTA